jgi:lysozyme family protein
MTDRFPRAFALVAVHEGGYVNHPDDPGGATNRGVTQRTYDAHRDRRGQPRRDVRQITDAEVQAIYRGQYWNAVKADDLPPGVAYCVFDAAVNSGPGRAARWLQEVIGARVDGVVGNETISKARSANASQVINRYCDRRLAFMQSLRHWNTFKNGWTRRVSEVRQQSLKWAAGQDPHPSKVEAPGKADGPQRFWPALIAALIALVAIFWKGK